MPGGLAAETLSQTNAGTPCEPTREKIVQQQGYGGIFSSAPRAGENTAGSAGQSEPIPTTAASTLVPPA